MYERLAEIEAFLKDKLAAHLSPEELKSLQVEPNPAHVGYIVYFGNRCVRFDYFADKFLETVSTDWAEFVKSAEKASWDRRQLQSEVRRVITAMFPHNGELSRLRGRIEETFFDKFPHRKKFGCFAFELEELIAMNRICIEEIGRVLDEAEPPRLTS